MPCTVHNKSLVYESYAKCVSTSTIITASTVSFYFGCSLFVFSQVLYFINCGNAELRYGKPIRTEWVDFVDIFFGMTTFPWKSSHVVLILLQIFSSSISCCQKFTPWNETHQHFAKTKREMKLNRRERNVQQVYVNPKRTCWYFD